MTYVKQNFRSGQTLKAEHLNHIEEGIKEIENKIPSTPGSVQMQVNDDGEGNVTISFL